MSGLRGNVIKVPVHDVSFKLEGPSVEYINETFALLWQKSGGSLKEPISVPHHSSPNAAIQIVRTLPEKVFTSGTNAIPDGEIGILEAYQRAIENATDYIYIENQYFTTKEIVDALFLALSDTKKPNLKVIILINNDVDAPKYHELQNKLMNQLLENYSERVGIFTLWSHEVKDSKHVLIRNFVHSKLCIVDDKWATLGSANLDGQGLITSQHLVLDIQNRYDITKRAIEMNAVIYNGVDGLPQSDIPGEMRRKLWMEHLGFNDLNDPNLKNESQHDGGWLGLWKRLAKEKLDNLNKTPRIVHQSRVLEWNVEKDPTKYLLKLGVSKDNFKNLKIMKEVKSFNFATGKWDD